MHRTALAGPQGRSRSGSCRARTLENRLSRNRAARRRPALCCRLRALLLRRRLVNRPRTGLRHNHAPQWPRRARRRRCRLGWLRLHGRRRDLRHGRSRCRLRRRRRRCRARRRQGNHNFGRRWRKNRDLLGGCGRRRSLRHRGRCGRNHWRRYHRTRHRRCRRSNRSGRGLGRDRRSRRRWRTRRRYGRWARRNLRHPYCRTRRSRRMCLLVDRLQHVARLGNVREVELRLDSLGGRTARPRFLPMRSFVVSGKMLPHFLRFVRFD